MHDKGCTYLMGVLAAAIRYSHAQASPATIMKVESSAGAVSSITASGMHMSTSFGHLSSISASTTGTSLSATFTASSTTTAVASTVSSLPTVGSFSRDYSPAGLQRLWDLVGSIQPPPFTSTVNPKLPIITPSAPPALYPDFFSPPPAKILPDLQLPKGFLFGVASAAYQVEGAAKDEGKGPSGWDWASRQPGTIGDNTTADIVDLHYFLYKEDVARIAALGVNAHSFSISWARILPFGTADSPLNQQGLAHYSDVIDYHLSMGVEPVVTLFHWDVPLALMLYYGGFTSPSIVDDFVHYAKTVFKAYNGRVKTWYTFNEPRVYCSQPLRLDPLWTEGGPGSSRVFYTCLLPQENSSTAPYHCSHNLLNAHTQAVKAFRELGINGEIAFKNDDFVGIPWRTNSTDDQQAVERHAAFRIGAFSNPVYTTGDWPEIMKETLDPTYLPRFTKQQVKDNLGTADFFAIDSYRTQYIAAPLDGLAACVSNTSHSLWPECHTVMEYDSNAGWAAGIMADPLSDSWLQCTPNFQRQSLKDLIQRWPTKKMYISEFGFVEPFENQRTELFKIKEDVARTNYFMSYLGQALLSLHEDGIPLAGTFSWAIMDNFEWGSGQSARFGIQYVNYTTLDREYKRSALALAEFFKAHGVPNMKVNSGA